MDQLYDWSAALERAHTFQTTLRDRTDTLKSRSVQDATWKLLLDMQMAHLKNQQTIVELLLQHKDIQVEADLFRAQLQNVLGWTSEMVERTGGMINGLDSVGRVSASAATSAAAPPAPVPNGTEHSSPTKRVHSSPPNEQRVPSKSQDETTTTPQPEAPADDDRSRKRQKSEKKERRRSSSSRHARPPSAAAPSSSVTNNITNRVLEALKALELKRKQKTSRARLGGQTKSAPKQDGPAPSPSATTAAVNGGVPGVSSTENPATSDQQPPTNAPKQDRQRDAQSAPPQASNPPFASAPAASRDQNGALKRRLSRDSLSDSGSVRSSRLLRPPRGKRIRTVSPRAKVRKDSGSRDRRAASSAGARFVSSEPAAAEAAGAAATKLSSTPASAGTSHHRPAVASSRVRREPLATGRSGLHSQPAPATTPKRQPSATTTAAATAFVTMPTPSKRSRDSLGERPAKKVRS